MRSIVEQFYADDPQITGALESFCTAALNLPVPEAGALVMVDMDPTQFITEGQRLTVLVDTEASAVGPCELDFSALEYVLTQRGAVALAKGYNAIRPLPDVSSVRPVYRYLYRRLEVQGKVELESWMAHPVLF